MTSNKCTLARGTSGGAKVERRRAGRRPPSSPRRSGRLAVPHALSLSAWNQEVKKYALIGDADK